MATKRNGKNEIGKPKKILELESIYKIEFVEETRQKSISDASYKLNSKGKIIGISISNFGIKDVNPIASLSDLEELNLTKNAIEDISPLSSLKKLINLYLGGNKIRNVQSIINLVNLKELTIWENPIVDLSIIVSLPNLQSLYCQDIGLETLTSFQKITELSYINAANNNVIDVSILQTIDKPLIVDLGENLIREIPFNVAKKFELNLLNTLRFQFDNQNNSQALSVSNNPLEFPPYSLIELGAESIQNYYEATNQFGHAPLSEGRIIVIGDGSAGKSSLIERILHDKFEQGKIQTNGIKIENWQIAINEHKKLTFHIWDFGGQEIQHAVHKFFFTEGCLYLLVLDNRKEEEPEYWLQQIESLGNSASVLVVFNKQDDNTTEIADRKFLKEKYPNIIGFYSTSCKTGLGIENLRTKLQEEAIHLRTVKEQFPNNWFEIKKTIEECTSDQHYLNYERYSKICKANNVIDDKTQKLLLKYFTTIGAVTWFGDTYLNFLHVLSPAWITQGVYKIITSKKTSLLLGQIDINDFEELLQPVNDKDYTYEDSHYGYILSMMKKFDLCYTPDDQKLLIPSAFGKEPKVEYQEFLGESVRTYILEFKDYMPLALIHRFIAKNLSNVFDNNFWYSGIVIKDTKSLSLAMVQADKIAKRIYVRIKGDSKLGMWEHIRREFDNIASSYANINYNELIALDDKSESTVNYDDLVSHIKAKKSIYFHPRLQRDFNVGYLIGLFETKDETIQKFEKGKLMSHDEYQEQPKSILPVVVNILNNNSPTLTSQVINQINIDIDIQVVNNISSELKGDTIFLLETLNESNQAMKEALEKVILFATDAKLAKNSGDVKEKGWGRRLKNILQILGNTGEQFKNIQDGREAFKSMLSGIKELAHQFNLNDIIEIFKHF